MEDAHEMTLGWLIIGALAILATWSLVEDLKATAPGKQRDAQIPELPDLIARYTTADDETDWTAFEAHVAKILAWEDQRSTFRDGVIIVPPDVPVRESLTVDIGTDHAEVVVWHQPQSDARRPPDWHDLNDAEDRAMDALHPLADPAAIIAAWRSAR